MNRIAIFTLLTLAMGLCLLGACTQDNAPAYGRSEKYARTHLQFGDAALEGRTRVEPVQATRDQFGLLHVTLSIRNTTNGQQMIAGYITFLRGGQFVEKLGPTTVTLLPNVFDTMLFDSTQPADDYFISLDYAK